MILIQIVAPGWKTYGQRFDIEQAEQTIPIHLSASHDSLLLRSVCVFQIPQSIAAL